MEEIGAYRRPIMVKEIKVASLVRDNYYQTREGQVIKIIGVGPSENTFVAELYKCQTFFKVMGLDSAVFGKYVITPSGETIVTRSLGLRKGLSFKHEDKRYFQLLVHKLIDLDEVVRQ